MPLLEELRKQLIRDEGEKFKPYLDTAKKTTIGVGRNLTDKGIRPRESAYLLENDIDEVVTSLSILASWTDGLDDMRRGVLLNMAFEMGIHGLFEFTETMAFVRAGRYSDAAKAMRNSLWAKEQSPARAERLAKQMETGLWQ